MKPVNLISTETYPGIINFLSNNINHNNKKETYWYAGYRHLLSFIDDIENNRILEYSRDGGNFFNLLCAINANVTSIDPSCNRITISDKTNSFTPVNYNFSPGSLDFLTEESFDYVFMNFSLSFISNRSEILKLLRYVNQSLKRKGSVVLLNTNWDKSNGKEFLSFGLDYDRRLSSGKRVTTFIKSVPPQMIESFYWSKTDFIDFLTDTGFEIHAIKEPLSRENDIKWLAETHYPPFHIIFAKKQ